MSEWWGKKSTFSKVLSALVIVMNNLKHLYCNSAMTMYHKSDPCGAYVYLFTGLPWIMILVPGGVSGVQLKLKMLISFSWAERFGLMMDLYIRFRVIVAWSNSLYQSWNVKYGFTLHNLEIKWFFNVHISHSSALRLFMFGGTSLNSVFLSWRLWIRM